MARPAEVTPEEVVAAGQALLAAGKKVNKFSLRKALDRGGYDYLERVWADAQAETQATSAPDESRPAAPLPPALAELQADLADKVSGFIEGAILTTWKAASDIAERRTTEEHAVAAGRISEIEEQLADAAASLNSADARADAAEIEQNRLADTLRYAEDQMQKMAGASQIAAETIADLTTKLDAAKEVIDIARREAAVATALATASKTDAERARTELVEFRKEAADAAAKQEAAGRKERERISAEMTAAVDRVRTEFSEFRKSAENAMAQQEAEVRQEQRRLTDELTVAIDRAARAEAKLELQPRVRKPRIESVDEQQQDTGQLGQEMGRSN